MDEALRSALAVNYAFGIHQGQRPRLDGLHREQTIAGKSAADPPAGVVET